MARRLRGPPRGSARRAGAPPPTPPRRRGKPIDRAHHVAREKEGEPAGRGRSGRHRGRRLVATRMAPPSPGGASKSAFPSRSTTGEWRYMASGSGRLPSSARPRTRVIREANRPRFRRAAATGGPPGPGGRRRRRRSPRRPRGPAHAALEWRARRTASLADPPDRRGKRHPGGWRPVEVEGQILGRDHQARPARLQECFLERPEGLTRSGRRAGGTRSRLRISDGERYHSGWSRTVLPWSMSSTSIPTSQPDAIATATRPDKWERLNDKCRCGAGPSTKGFP